MTDAKPDTGPAPLGTIKAVAEAILALTYTDTMDIATSIRDITADRMGDGEFDPSEVTHQAALLNDWAAGRIEYEE